MPNLFRHPKGILKQVQDDIRRFIYVTSEIGLRKGFDIVYSLFTNPKILEQKFHLDIIGLP